MRVRSRNWLTTLRRWRHATLLASLPALLAAALTAAACVAMPATDAPAHAVHAAADAGAAHRHHAAAAEELPAPCPHCPFDGGAANVTTSGCAPTDTRLGAPTANPEPPAPLPTASIMAAAFPISPLIRHGPARASPPPPRVPLNLRHCVLLI